MNYVIGSVVAVAMLAPVHGTASDILFAAPRDYAAVWPWAIATADFNNDARPDVVLTNVNADSVTVKLNGGPALTAAVGPAPTGVSVADFNRDGRIDVAVTVHGGNSVAVLLGNGDGTLQAARRYPAEERPVEIDAADFNGDLNPDVLFSTQTGAAAVLLGNGDGTLRSPMPLPSSGDWQHLAVGDFNGDGRTDIADPGDQITVLPGAGDGTFLAPLYTPFGYTWGVAAGDFNTDGRLDLAAVIANTDRVGVLIGRGDGTFEGPTNSQPVTLGTESPVVGDINKDGKLDVVCVNAGGHDPVLLGVGDGGLRSPVYVLAGRTGWRANGVAILDWNGDHHADLMIAAPTSPAGTLAIRLGNGDGTFARAPGLWTGLNMRAVATADFNGDGTTDMATVGEDSDEAYLATVLSNGDGTFRPSPPIVRTGFRAQALVPADFDRDGDLDLVLLAFDQLHLLRGRGDGSFAATEILNHGFGGQAVAASDLNGDGAPDLVVANLSSHVFALLGDGTGAFSASVRGPATTNAADMTVGDFNGDGATDVALAEFSADTVAIAFGNGDGTFGPLIQTGVGAEPMSLTAADFNGDGRTDLGVAHATAEVRALVSNGDGSFQSTQYVVMDGVSGRDNYDTIRAADLNGDGTLDLAVLGGNTLSILGGGGDGRFRLQGTGFSASVRVPQQIALGDFTGDGRLEVAVAGLGGVALLHNTTQ